MKRKKDPLKHSKYGVGDRRRMGKINWTERVINEHVLTQVGETRSIIKTIKR